MLESDQKKFTLEMFDVRTRSEIVTLLSKPLNKLRIQVYLVLIVFCFFFINNVMANPNSNRGGVVTS